MANSIKDMVSSVDWSKLMTGGDARNALVGSALGGLLLGGAGMAAERDPEESKFAPVNDALLGALLGGVAGYGIPKGLSMFRDAGSLAPDNDQLSNTALGKFWNGARPGFILGSAGIGASLIPTHVRAALSRAHNAAALRQSGVGLQNAIANAEATVGNLNSTDAGARATARANQLSAIAHGGSGKINERMVYSYKDALRYLKDQLRGAADATAREDIRSQLKQLKNARSIAKWGIRRGFAGYRDILDTIASEPLPPVPDKAGFIRRLFHGFTNGSKHYGVKGVGPFNPRAGLRMLGRAGKYGAILAAITGAASVAAPKVLDNIKK